MDWNKITNYILVGLAIVAGVIWLYLLLYFYGA